MLRLNVLLFKIVKQILNLLMEYVNVIKTFMMIMVNVNLYLNALQDLLGFKIYWLAFVLITYSILLMVNVDNVVQIKFGSIINANVNKITS